MLFMHISKSILQGVIQVGYILPFPNLQSYQYMMRLLQKEERFSYIHQIQHVKQQSHFGEEWRRKNKNAEIKFRKQLNVKKHYLNKSPHNSSDDLKVANITGKGLYFDFYI